MKINGQLVLPANLGESACDVNLKAGWNKVEIVCQFQGEDTLNISFRPKGSISAPRPILPKDFFYDEKPEEDW